MGLTRKIRGVWDFIADRMLRPSYYPLTTRYFHLRHIFKVFHGEFELKIWVRYDSIFPKAQSIFHPLSPARVSGVYCLFKWKSHPPILVHRSVAPPSFEDYPDVCVNRKFQPRTRRIQKNEVLSQENK